MGSLKPGATYVYERSNGVTYAREKGADPSTRVAIGWDYDSRKNLSRHELWQDIILEARNNPALQKAVERVIMLYYLSKDHGA